MKADPTILQMKYADVIALLAKTADISLDAALKIFYESEVYQLMRNGISDLHCMSVPYLVELILEEPACDDLQAVRNFRANPEASSPKH